MVIEDAIKKTLDMDQQQLRQGNQTVTQDGEVLPFVHTYNPRNPNIFQRILEALSMLNESSKMRLIMERKKVVPSKRQPPNLKLLLTKSKFSLNQSTGCVKKCGDPCCSTCDYIIEGESIVMENGDLFFIKDKLTCQSKNVVYVLFCAGCNKSYIGETGEQLNKRANGHRTQIFNSDWRSLEVAHHIAECTGARVGGPRPFSIAPFF